MSASQKAAVLLTGLICIGVIGYFFQQTQSATPATPLTIAPQASEDATGVTQVSATAEQASAERPTAVEAESRIGLADLVAQFADVYEEQKQQEQAAVADASPPAQPQAADGMRPLPEPAIRESSVASGPQPGARSTAAAPSAGSHQPLPPGTAVDIDSFDFATEPAASTASTLGSPPTPSTARQPMPRTLTIGEPAPTPVTSVANNSSNPTSTSPDRTSSSLEARVRDMPVVMRVDVRPDAVASDGRPVEQPTSYEPPAQPEVLRTREAPTRPAQPLFESEPAPTPMPTVQRTYTVQRGDSFSSIAVTLFGSEKRYLDIARANPDVDPRRLRAGQVIRLPDDVSRSTASRSRGSQASTSTASRASSQKRYHIVGAGDNLSGIASDYYSDGSKWREIYQANRAAIGSNPNKLKLGMKLTIPATD